MWNNPAIAVARGRVYIIPECLVFRGRSIDQLRSRMIVLSAEPSGAPSQWRWRYDGVLADRALAQALGGERLVSAAIMPGRNGELLFIATPQTGRGPFGQGCVAIALESSRSAAPAPHLQRGAAHRGAPNRAGRPCVAHGRMHL